MRLLPPVVLRARAHADRFPRPFRTLLADRVGRRPMMFVALARNAVAFCGELMLAYALPLSVAAAGCFLLLRDAPGALDEAHVALA